jgi:hypothetical protein
MHEARKRRQLRQLFEEQNELLLRALQECRANAAVGRRRSPRTNLPATRPTTSRQSFDSVAQEAGRGGIVADAWT